MTGLAESIDMDLRDTTEQLINAATKLCLCFEGEGVDQEFNIPAYIPLELRNAATKCDALLNIPRPTEE